MALFRAGALRESAGRRRLIDASALACHFMGCIAGTSTSAAVPTASTFSTTSTVGSSTNAPSASASTALGYDDGGLLEQLLAGRPSLAELVDMREPRTPAHNLQMMLMLAGRDPRLLASLGTSQQVGGCAVDIVWWAGARTAGSGWACRTCAAVEGVDANGADAGGQGPAPAGVIGHQPSGGCRAGARCVQQIRVVKGRLNCVGKMYGCCLRRALAKSWAGGHMSSIMLCDAMVGEPLACKNASYLELSLMQPLTLAKKLQGQECSSFAHPVACQWPLLDPAPPSSST